MPRAPSPAAGRSRGDGAVIPDGVDDVPVRGAEYAVKPEDHDANWTDVTRLERLVVFGFALVSLVTAAGIALAPAGLRTIASDSVAGWLAIGTRALMLVALGLAYFWSADSEKSKLLAVGKEYLRSVPWFAPLILGLFVLSAIIAVAGTLIAPLFGIGLLGLKTAEAAGSWVVKQQLRLGLGDLLVGEGSADTSRLRQASVLAQYYLGHPWEPLLTFQMLLLALLTGADLALAAAGLADLDVWLLATSIGYGVVVAANEAVAFRWRRRRDVLWEDPPIPSDHLHELLGVLSAPASPRGASAQPKALHDESGVRSTPVGRTQRITASDIRAGVIRIPIGQKMPFPAKTARTNIVIRGTRLRDIAWDPRVGPDRERSGRLSIGQRLGTLVSADEVFAARREGRTIVFEPLDNRLPS